MYLVSSATSAPIDIQKSLKTSGSPKKRLQNQRELHRFLKTIKIEDRSQGIKSVSKKKPSVKKLPLEKKENRSDSPKYSFSEMLLNIPKMVKKLKFPKQLPLVDTVNALSFVFELEKMNRFDQHLSDDCPNTQLAKKLDRELVVGWANQAKVYINERPFHACIVSAAKNGVALQSALNVFKRVQNGKPRLKANRQSTQKVFFLYKERAFFKQFHRPREEESDLACGIHELTSSQSISGSFKIDNFFSNRFGIEISNSNYSRGLKLSSLSPEQVKLIKGHLSRKDRRIVEFYQNHLRENPLLSNFKQMELQEWICKFHTRDAWKSLTLKNIQKLYQQDKLYLSAKIGTSKESAISFKKHIHQGTPFFNALTYFPTLGKEPTVYLVPDLRDPIQQTAYTSCEKFRWSFTKSLLQKKQGDFVTLFFERLLGPVKHINPIVSNVLDEGCFLTEKTLTTALNTALKIITPELLEVEKHQISRLSRLQVNPFIENMILLKDLRLYPIALKNITNRLTLESEWLAVQTGILQYTDLHGKNLGVVPVLNSKSKQFENLIFRINHANQDFSFTNLIFKYFNQEISSETIITVIDENVKTTVLLKDFPELVDANNIFWELKSFDHDHVLLESSKLSQIEVGGSYKHLIPIRSVLLEISLKDRPLNQKTISRILKQSNDLSSWMNRYDSAIWKQLPESCISIIRPILDQILPFYNFNDTRKKSQGHVTREILENWFVDYICDLTIQNNFVFWQEIDKYLGYVPLFPNDTFEKIATRHHVDLELVKSLNEKIDLRQEKKIKIVSLLNHDPLSAKARRRIAKGFFPRLTFAQQKAFHERVGRLTAYLQNHETLLKSTMHGHILLTQIIQFIEELSTPLSSLEKEKYLTLLQKNTPAVLNPEFILRIRKRICDKCQPTYANTLKAMYPFLPDALDLNERVYGPKNAGTAIGLFTRPLEEAIDLALNPKTQPKLKSPPKFKTTLTPAVKRLALKLQSEVLNPANSCFTGRYQA